MFLYGASGHAKVIIDILHSTGVKVDGLFDDNPNLRELSGIEVLGKYTNNHSNQPLIISIGDNRIRSKIGELLDCKFGKAIASSAVISSNSFVDIGSVIMQGVVIQASVNIGKHVIVNTSASIDHDCIIQDYVHISPKACLCGNVQVGKGTHIGAGATIIPNIRIGEWCKIGAGAVVIKDIPDFATAVGNPARIIKRSN